MELSYESIMDYYRCPLLYHLKYNLKLKRDDTERYLYLSCLHKVIMFFYYQVLNGNIPSLEVMRNKWYKQWNKDRSTLEDILFKPIEVATHPLANYTLEGLKVLELFYAEETNTDFMPIVVDTDVRVKVGDYHLTGTLELVRELRINDKQSIIELARFNNSRYATNQFLIDNDFKLTFQSYAFRKLFNTKENRLILYNIKKGEKIVTLRDEYHFKKFETIVKNVGDSISEKRFHPIVTYQCRQCLYQDVCDKFKF